MSVSQNVCPLDFRYGRRELKAIFSEEAKLNYYLRVEAALVRALANHGVVPESGAKDVEDAVLGKRVKLDRVKAIESEIKHDVMAVVRALAEVSGEGGKYVHYGATSYDIVDTANALQIRDALAHIRSGIKALALTLCDLAMEHRDTVMVGRTHGQHALPMTFGLKMAVFASEMERHYIRLNQAEERVCVGKLSGAVGTMAALGAKAMDIQRDMLRSLGLGIEIPATQIVQRDRYIELLSLCANIATSMERFATEVRNLQRTEIGECAEAFDEKGQVGSSTMAHKRNPITCENVSGLARIVRAMIIPAFENAIQWHERDLANSSAERFIIPHALILTDDILWKMNSVFSNLVVDRERMRANLGLTKGAIMAEAVMMSLVGRGWGRQEAHERVRRISLRAQREGRALVEVLMEDDEVASAIGDDLGAIMEPENYIGQSVKLVETTVERVRATIEA